MKGGLKDADEPRTWDEAPELAYGFKVRPIVRRSDGKHGPHALQNGLIQLVYPVKAPGQHCFEAYGAYLVHRVQRPVFPRAEVGEKERYAGGIVRHAEPLAPPGPAVFPAVLIDGPVRTSHALDLGLAEHPLPGHVEEFKFERSAPNIAHKDFHVLPPLFHHN